MFDTSTPQKVVITITLDEAGDTLLSAEFEPDYMGSETREGRGPLTHAVAVRMMLAATSTGDIRSVQAARKGGELRDV